MQSLGLRGLAEINGVNTFSRSSRFGSDSQSAATKVQWWSCKSVQTSGRIVACSSGGTNSSSSSKSSSSSSISRSQMYRLMKQQMEVAAKAEVTDSFRCFDFICWVVFV